MTVQLLDVQHSPVAEVRLSGRLEKSDYEQFVPFMERQFENAPGGKIRLLCVMEDFEGWTAGGMWEDLKWDVKHFNDIEKLAMVGEAKWQEAMSDFCKPFTTAEIRYFELANIGEAREWLAE